VNWVRMMIAHNRPKVAEIVSGIRKYDVVIPYHVLLILLALFAVGFRPWEWF
jgi:hypothetical protein